MKNNGESTNEADGAKSDEESSKDNKGKNKNAIDEKRPSSLNRKRPHKTTVSTETAQAGQDRQNS